ncbi:MAG: M60 family metallopeptidase [Bacteroidaceae bacterium]|nr:M60 family metallopeptidase [Bacteroidaceae bacterium]
MKYLRQIFVLALLVLSCSASSAVSSGYYRIVSNIYAGRYITENISEHSLTTAALLEGNFSQVWYLNVSGSNVTIKNALSDRFVTTCGSWSVVYTTDTNAKSFALTESDGTFTFTDKWNAGPHCAATQSYNVVLWYTDADASVWRLEPVEVDETALEAQKTALTEVSAAQLTKFFTSTACTELRSSYASMSDANLRSAMSALPTTVRNMALKVKNNSWTTYSGWDKTEKTFRVADYKAYSSGDRWTGILGYGHHFGRLSNPTGIYAKAGEVLQVYVGTIPYGQTVKLEIAGYGQASGSQYALHEGMNVILVAASGNCFVFYEVDNTTDGAAPYTPIATYAPVTVHVEGGIVQGCFDLTRSFTNADFAAMKAYLMTEETFCLKSSTHVFNLYRDLLISALGIDMKVEEMMNYWTGTAQLQDDLTARGDFDEYCNNVYSVTGHAGSGNPHATTYGTNYYEAAYAGLFNVDQLQQSSGSLWTIAHEQGHNRQRLIQMIGTTEISNNTFSNAALDWQGRYTSRVNSLRSSFDRWQNGESWPQRVASDGTWDCLHLYTQLYQYFHQAGYDTDFFPNLFRAFRQSPMTLRSGTPVPASEDYLKFYKTCCDVAQVDLTEFFEVYSFFILPPYQEAQTINGVNTGNYYQQIGDYVTYYVYVTQAMIDEAKAYVAAKKYPKSNIMFIEDRITAPLATYEGHAEGEVRKTYDGTNVADGAYGETGQYTTFDEPCSDYSFNVSERGNVTVSGTGAVGFKLYDASGNLVGVYNTTTFTLPAAAFDEDGLRSGYVIKAAAGDGTDAAMARDESIDVSDFPKTDMWYTFNAKRAPGRYIESQGVGGGLVGTSASTISSSMQWRFVAREGETESFDIVNRDDGSYINPSASYNAQISTSETQPSSGWKVQAVDDYYIIFSGSTQFNQTTNAYSFKLYNWGGGGKTDDDGCLFVINAVEPIYTPTLSNEPLEELNGYYIKVASEAAANLATGQWYVMYDRGVINYEGTDYYHGYLYEQVSSHTLYNTLTAPSGKAVDACRHLVRLLDAGDGKYYLQTGYGNYFGKIEQSIAVPVLPTMTQRITIAKIANTDGHFYLQAEDGGLILDANWAYSGVDSSVVGWGTTVPTTLNGNNDWAFYPVTLVGLGDVNADGSVTIADVTALVNIILGSSMDTVGVADVNGDGAVTIADVTALVNIILGK